MKKILSGVMASVLVVAGLAFLAQPAAAAGNGIQVGHFAYTPETDPTGWLNNICNVADEKPEFVVLNIGNGHTDDVGKLDVLAEQCQTAGVKTLGYVHLVDSLDYDSDSNTTELRPVLDVAADVDYWTNPFNPERTNYSVFLDGIMTDQMPADCGNVTYISAITDMVHDKFAFWSYPTPLVMGNAGTAIRDCIPGYALAPYSQPMPDRYITFEGTYATYASSYLGGNVSNGSIYYNGENTFGQDMFVHIVYDADQSEMEAASRLADNRGAAFIFATDDVLANPYDAPPSYMDADTRWAATPHMIFDDGFDGIEFAYSGSPSMPILAQLKLTNNTGYPDSDLVDRIEALILQECYVDISTDNAYSGDVGNSVDTRGTNSGFEGWDLSYTSLDSGFVTCVKEAIQPGPNPNDPALYICNDIVGGFPTPTQVTDYDCRNPDGSSDPGDENVNEDATEFLWDVLDNNATVEEFIVLVRDRFYEDGNDGSGGANCINTAGRRCLEPANPAPGGLGQWRWPSSIIIRPNHAPIQAITGFELGWATSSGGGFPNP